ncbi:ssDNA-binding protein [Ralstonia solanacearum]|uniref:ssDNA-binding protein n=1 Tax=Ralstonia solanacearum TaxID=305 RepID=UPI0018D1D57B|nr:ssDNA-binding protein [Ralstonia solanacearum]
MAEAKKKSKIIEKCVSPKGIFIYAWLAKPDNSEYGKGKFKCAILLEKGVKVNDEFAKKLNAAHKAAKGKLDSRPAKDGDELAEDNEKKEKLRGYWVITAKTKQKPTQKAADGKTELKETARSGDFGRMSVALAEYDTGANKGVTLYLNGIKLLERRAGEDLGFEDESDEYENDEGEAETEDRTEDSDDSNASDDNSDF